MFILIQCLHDDSPFRTKKFPKKPKKTRTKSKATKRPAKKKSNAAELFNLDEKDDDDESEVELDSLGSFFNHLIDIDYHQDEVEASRADDEEVIIILLWLRISTETENSTSKPESKVFSPFRLLGSQLYFEEAAT